MWSRTGNEAPLSRLVLFVLRIMFAFSIMFGCSSMRVNVGSPDVGQFKSIRGTMTKSKRKSNPLWCLPIIDRHRTRLSVAIWPEIRDMFMPAEVKAADAKLIAACKKFKLPKPNFK